VWGTAKAAKRTPHDWLIEIFYIACFKKHSKVSEKCAGYFLKTFQIVCKCISDVSQGKTVGWA
jgi:hypothetical protein